MIRIKHIIVLVFCALGLACSPASDPASANDAGPSASTATAAEYRCGNATVRFRLAGDSPWLEWQAKQYPLQPVRAASGARYRATGSDEPIQFWDKGERALLEIGGKTYPECRIIGADGGVSLPFSASGNEPGWTLDILPERMILAWQYGKQRRTTPRPAAATGPDQAIVYAAETEAGSLRVEIQDRLCRDSMTGVPHPMRVTVTIDKQTLNGCGGSPESLLQSAEWIVEDIAKGGVIDRSLATLNFGVDGRLSGLATCNRYSGAYELTGEG